MSTSGIEAPKSRILTDGGFTLLQTAGQAGSRVRLYCLKDPFTQEKIESAKKALQQEFDQKQRILKGGDLKNFEAEIKEKPYLLKEGKTLHLTKAKKIQKPDGTTIQTIQISNLRFESNVAVGGGFHIAGDTVFNFIQPAASHLDIPSPSNEELVQKVAIQLRVTYCAKKSISLLIPQDLKEILIEKLYTRLAIIGESEKKQKKKEAEGAIVSLGQESYGITPTHEAIFEPKEAIKLEDLFNQGKLKDASQKRILIQGSAGIGKSTLCHHIAYRWAKGTLFKEFKYLFWLPLRNLNNDKEYYRIHGLFLNTYLSHECGVEPDSIDAFLKNKELQKETLLLLDGYDELSQAAVSNPEILKELKAFPHVLITTRPQSVNFDSVCSLEILGFDANGVEDYVDRFFSKEQQSQAQELRRHLRHPLVRSLARIPINLEIFCSLAAAGKPLFGSKTPTMTALYIQLTDWLFKRFKIERLLENPDFVIGELDTRDAETVKCLGAALEEIAWKAMEGDTLYLPERQITAIFRSKGVESGAKRVGPLRIEGNEGVFIHLTFQEFFAAAHLARLYENNPQEAEKQLAQIKFKPRYQQVLPMTAGYLADRSEVSSEAEKGLQTFFNDLFSEPQDLAISYELRLQARCFEECDKPKDIPQYQPFVDTVVAYLKKQPIERLKIELLTGTAKLFNHEQVVAVFVEDLRDTAKRKRAIRVLGNIANRGQSLPEAALSALVGILKDSTVNTEVKSSAAKALREVAESGHSLAEEALSALVGILKDSKVNAKVKISAAYVLREVAKSGHSLAEEALSALVGILKDSKVNAKVKSSAAEALGEVAMSGHSLAEEALSALVGILKDSKVNDNVKFYAANALGEVAESGHSLAEEALSALVGILKDSKVNAKVKSSAAEALGGVAESGHSLPEAALSALVDILKDSKMDDDVKSSAADALGEVAKSGQSIPEAALSALVDILKDSKVDDDVKSSAADALGEVAKSGQSILEAALSALVDILKDSKVDDDVKSSAADALGEVAKSGHSFPEEILLALVDFLKDSKVVDYIKFHVAKVLGEVAKSGQSLPKEILSALVGILKDSKVNAKVKSCAAYALGEVANSGHSLPEAALSALVDILKDSKVDDDVKSSAADALGEVAKSGQSIPEAALSALVDILKDSKVDDDVTSSVAYALGEVAMSGQSIPEAALSALVDILKDSKVDDDVKSSAADALGEVAKSGQSLPEATLSALVSILKDSKVVDYIKSHVAKVLGEVAKSGQSIPEAALSALVDILKDSKVDDDVTSSVAYALGVVAMSGHSLAEEALSALVGILKDSKVNAKVKSSVAYALGEIAKSGHSFPEEILLALVDFLKDSKVNDNVKSSVTKVLVEVAKSGQSLAEAALSALIGILKDSKVDDDVKSPVAKALEEAVKNSKSLPENALLIVQLCFFTGHAFFFQNDNFYISNSNNPLQITKRITLAESCKELLGENFKS